jgi:hypothetical protein
MKDWLIFAGRIEFALAVWLAASFVPLVPAMQAPVVPDPDYEWALVSIQDLVGIGIFRLGVSHRATWGTFPVMIGLTAAALAGGWMASGYLLGSHRATGSCPKELDRGTHVA